MSEVSWRDRIVAEARHITTTDGWHAVTMARLGAAVGVSRQTVYNEVGTKTDLADLMVGNELSEFLTLVEGAFATFGGDLHAVVVAAVSSVLDFARDNDLIRVVISATHGGDDELLPLLTAHSQPLIATAKAVVSGQLDRLKLSLSPWELGVLSDGVVRMILSHVVAPDQSTEETAEAVAWLADRIVFAGERGPNSSGLA